MLLEKSIADSNASHDIEPSSTQFYGVMTPSDGKVGKFRSQQSVPESIQQSAHNFPIMEEVEEDAMNTYYEGPKKAVK